MLGVRGACRVNARASSTRTRPLLPQVLDMGLGSEQGAPRNPRVIPLLPCVMVVDAQRRLAEGRQEAVAALPADSPEAPEQRKGGGPHDDEVQRQRHGDTAHVADLGNHLGNRGRKHGMKSYRHTTERSFG